MLGMIIVTEIAVILLVVVGAVAFVGLSHVGSMPAGSLGIVIVVAVMALIFIPLAVVAVRLSLAGPMTFAQRRVRLTGSWALTRGRFWSMFGAYLLAGVLITLAAVLLMIVCCVIAFMLGGIAGVRGLFFPDASSLGAFFTPERIVLMVLNAPIGALWIGIQAAVPAALYAQIVSGSDPGHPGADRSHVFGSAAPAEPVPPPPDTEYPIVPTRDARPPEML